MTILDFLTHVWQDKPDDQHILIWTRQNKRSRWFTRVADAADHAATVGCSMDVYVGVGLAGKDYGPGHRCVSSEVTGICGIAADFDLLSDAHAGKDLPETIDQALMLVPPEMPPTIIIRTGNGVHCWWLLKEPYIFDGDEDRTQAAGLVGRWHSLLKLNAARFGWAYERLADLARILRIPSTQNFKDPANPKPVTLHSCTERRYNLSDFEAYLDGVVLPDPEPKAGADRSWEERFDGKDMAIQLDAAIPADVLDDWMAMDPRFRRTWNRQRDDLRDQSQSGYDMALANFGVDAGLTEQQIVNLIIHHRRRHAQRCRSRQDYYMRTIAAAMNRGSGIEPPPAPAQAGEAAQELPHDEGGQGDTPSPDSVRAALCERVSKALGVQILRLVKITGQEPVYHMHLDGGTVLEFETYARLTDQRQVRNAIGAATNRYVAKIKPKVWEGIVQVMLDALTETAGGDENDLKASTRLSVDRYLREVGFIDAPEKQPVHAQRKPALIDGCIAVSASDLHAYINKTNAQPVSVKAVTSRLAALGAENIRPRSGPFRDQSRWVLPTENFAPADYCNWLLEGGTDARA